MVTDRLPLQGRPDTAGTTAWAHSLAERPTLPSQRAKLGKPLDGVRGGTWW